MRSRLALALVLLLALQSWSAVSLPKEAEARASDGEEEPFRDVVSKSSAYFFTVGSRP